MQATFLPTIVTTSASVEPQTKKYSGTHRTASNIYLMESDETGGQNKVQEDEIIRIRVAGGVLTVAALESGVLEKGNEAAGKRQVGRTARSNHG